MRQTHLAIPFHRISALLALAFSIHISSASEIYAEDGTVNPVKSIIQALDINSFGDARLRYHTVDQEAFPDNSIALSLRVKAGVEFNIFQNSSVLLELEGSENFIERFNDTLNGKISRPIIGDPASIELNRFQLQTQLSPQTRVTLGRQKIALDNWRFIGHWPFRQNEQTFDAARLETKIGSGLLDAAYIGRVQRQFGNDSPVGEFEGQSTIINYGHPVPFGRLSAFYYGLDLETGETGNRISNLSSATAGLRVNGRYKWENWGLNWDGSIAQQTDFADNPNDFAALFASSQLNLEFDNFEFGLKGELLGSDNGQAVQTPLAALHRTQGLADVFLITPDDGLRDYSISAGYNLRNYAMLEDIQFKVSHHWFESDAFDRKYGQEIDFSLSAKWKNLRFGLEYADYNADTFSSDTQVLILSTEFNFD